MNEEGKDLPVSALVVSLAAQMITCDSLWPGQSWWSTSGPRWGKTRTWHLLWLLSALSWSSSRGTKVLTLRTRANKPPPTLCYYDKYVMNHPFPSVSCSVTLSLTNSPCPFRWNHSGFEGEPDVSHRLPDGSGLVRGRVVGRRALPALYKPHVTGAPGELPILDHGSSQSLFTWRLFCCT